MQGKVFRKIDVVTFKAAADTVRGLLRDLERIDLAGQFEIADRVLGPQFKANGQMPRRLRVVSLRPQRNAEVRFETVNGNALVILKFQPLGTVRWDWSDLRAEDRRPASFVGSALAHLQQARVDVLLLQAVVNFFRTLAFQYHCGKTHRTVPGGEVGDRGAAVQRENVIPFFNSRRMIGEDLLDEDAGIRIVDADDDLHLLQREYCRVWLVLVARNEHARIAPQRWDKRAEDNQQFERPFHGRVCSGMRTRPLSVPTYM